MTMRLRSNRSVRPLAASFALPVVLALVATGCGEDPVTRAQFLDHAVKFSVIAKTPEQKESMRLIFDCVWPEISKDEELLDEFMAANESNTALSAKVSKLMAPCLMAGSPTTTTTPGETTTVPEAPVETMQTIPAGEAPAAP